MSVQPIREPQDRRPKKAAERATTRKQKAMDAEAFGMRVDGEDYILNPNDLTGRLDFEIRRDCGMGVIEILQAAERTSGMDFVGMFMWACKRAQGVDADLMEMLDKVNANMDAELMTPEDIAEATAPKASGSAS